MFAATAHSQSCWLVPYGPNTDTAVRLGATIPVDPQRGLTGRPSVRPQDTGTRCSLEWTALLTGAQWAALRNATQVAQDESILVPAWPFAVAATVALGPTSGLIVAWTAGWGTWAINPGSVAGFDYQAPLLWGRFAAAPKTTGRNGEHVLIDFSFEEDGAAADALTAPTASDATFATASGYPAPVFPFIPEGTTPPNPGTAVVEVDRQEVGPGRIKSTTFYPQSPERIHQAHFKFKSAAAALQLLGWWQRRAGMADAHWVAESQIVGRLAADTAAGASALTFSGTLNPLGIASSLALFDPHTLELARVDSVAGLTANLHAPLANSWLARSVNVCLAMLARHTDKELVIEFRRADTDWVAEAQLNWREAASEYTAAADETRGTTLGRLPGAWFGFQIDLDYAGAVQTWYLTNYGSGGSVIGGQTWVYNACDFDKILKAIDGSDDSCTITARWFAGGPWANWIPGNLSAVGWVTIYRADADPSGALSNFRSIGRFQMAEPTRDGPAISQKCLGANAFFARMGPRQTMSLMCGTNLFKTRCTLLLSDWTFNATITAIAGAVVTVGTITRANGAGLPTGFAAADWFALGWMGWPVGGLPMRAGILTSAPIGGGTVSFTLDRATTLAIGTAVTLVPGCDRTAATCNAKFANHGHFRGYEDVPAIAPSFIIPHIQNANSKK